MKKNTKRAIKGGNTKTQPENPINIEEITPTYISLPIIDRSSLTITKTILGIGAQGKIYKGTWVTTPVAVKSYKILQKHAKNIMREVSIANQIRHPNIIQIMGLCHDRLTLYIVTELVEGNNLYDILFDSSVRDEFTMNEKEKLSVASQLCQAVNYLHLQKIPIVHRDIKPENVLITQQLLVKLCDLGLSKYVAMSTQLNTTVGTGSDNLRGTLLYMAPEILLNGAQATIYSDRWSLACTIIELFNEERVWEIDDCEDVKEFLRSVLRNVKCPVMIKVPSEIHDMVISCFSMDPTARQMITIKY